MAITFKQRKGKKTNTILLDVRLGRKIRVRCSTGQTIKKGSEKYWDKKKGRIKIPNDVPNAQQINTTLRNYTFKIESEIQRLSQKGKLSQENCDQAIKQILNIQTNQEVNENEPKRDVIGYFQHYIDYYSKNNTITTGRPLNKGTIKTYRNSMECLQRFMNYKKQTMLFFEDIDKTFYDEFVQFGYEMGYSHNYIGTIVQKLKTIMRSAYDENIHKNREFDKKYFRKLKEVINHPYLDESELEALFKVKLQTQIERDARDIFLLGCYTALRVGDMKKFLIKPQKEKINGRDFFYIKQNKTSNEVYIPLHKNLKKILARRGGKCPPLIHENIINQLIKGIAKKAGIKSEFILERTEGGKKIKISKPKCKFISFHTARRSFCTNAYNAGVPPHQIMVISGHKSEKVFMDYIKSSVKTKASKVAEHPFFH